MSNDNAEIRSNGLTMGPRDNGISEAYRNSKNSGRANVYYENEHDAE